MKSLRITSIVITVIATLTLIAEAATLKLATLKLTDTRLLKQVTLVANGNTITAYHRGGKLKLKETDLPKHIVKKLDSINAAKKARLRRVRSLVPVRVWVSGALS